MIEPSLLQIWVPIALGVINLGGWLWAILQSPSKKNAEAIAELAKALTSIEKRTSTLEEALRHLPDRDSVHRLELTVERVTGMVSVMGEKLEGVDRTSRRVEDYLLTSGNKAA